MASSNYQLEVVVVDVTESPIEPGLFHSKCRRNMVEFIASSTSSIYYRV
ncbi:hypothetical protein IQ276_018910 [Desmonostoc muscorum LEGE 12446]|uniref:Uncharacterized protein n=1 Tax=Desmonostoc muscorum LEGE 12446 TaxID=1828758 RepID=A0A8J6ZYC1_DESMC|nr:hypothetical protein [Desmonostoc muscorum]MCF2148458.1 hypothetical protein [Desmonostoc muscorum LEGE 12446]